MKGSSYRERDYVFGQLMLTVRTKLKLTQTALADLLGVRHRAVIDWEGGLTSPNVDHLKHFVVLAMERQPFPAVLKGGQKSKLENVRQEEYPTKFALSLHHKDLRLIMNEADEVSVPTPATAMTLQMYIAALAKGMDADFSILIKFMQ
jgi:transcriptional regulator with XRE-family HTH domain